MSSGATVTADTSFAPPTDLAAATHTLYLQERDAAGNWSPTSSFAIIIDVTAPAAPVVSGDSPTNKRKPTWSWATGGGGGSGYYRFRLDNSNFTQIRFIPTTVTQYQPSADLTAGSHTLYVQEEDAAGNWSASGSKTIVIDTTAGNSPTITGTTPTSDNTPTWSWTSGGGKGYYMYRLNDSNIEGSPTYTSATSFTPLSVLPDGTYVLYVKEQDAAGNWSPTAYFGITVDTQKPGTPTFAVGSTLSPASTRSVTWVWQTGGGGYGRYQYSLNGGAWSGEVTTASYTAGSLSDGNNILYVRERDAAGNWSDAGSRTVDVFPAPTNLRITYYQRQECVSVQWNDNSSSESGYRLIVYVNCGDTTNPSCDVRHNIKLDADVTHQNFPAADALCSGVYFQVVAFRSNGIITIPITAGKTGGDYSGCCSRNTTDLCP